MKAIGEKRDDFGGDGYGTSFFKELDGETDDVMHRITMCNIGELIMLAYGLNANLNPLPFLRKRYPKFGWSFIDFDKGDGFDESMEHVTSSNFVWYIGGRRYVVATASQAGSQLKIFWSSEGGGGNPASDHDRQREDYVRELKSAGFELRGSLAPEQEKSDP